MSADQDTSIRDVERTGHIVTTAQWLVAAVVMAGSAYSAGLAFQHFQESFVAGFITGVAVDCALASWLLIARRLRATDVKTAWGPILEGATAFMTLCLNSGVSVLNEKYLLAFFHAFLPAVLFILSMAGGEAQHKLHRLMKAKEAEQQAEREAQIAVDNARYESDRAARDAAKRDENARVDQIRKDDMRKKELDAEKHQREMADKAADRETRTRELVNSVAAALLVSTTLHAASARDTEARICAGREQGTRTMASALLVSAILRGPRQRRRQSAASPPPASVASRPPARHQPASPARRQPVSPAATSPRAAATPDMGRLVKLAKELLAREPGMGRPTLAKQLAAATGEPVTDYRAKQVLAEIEKEREAQWQKDLETVLGGSEGA